MSNKVQSTLLLIIAITSTATLAFTVVQGRSIGKDAQRAAYSASDAYSRADELGYDFEELTAKVDKLTDEVEWLNAYVSDLTDAVNDLRR